MSNIRKNFIFNVILTVSGYLFPLLTFPYVSRVLGVENIGIVNFAQSIIDYFVLFSSLGITVVGLRDIAQCHDDLKKRSLVFSKLLSIHLLLSFLGLAIYISFIYVVPELFKYKTLYWIGTTKIIFNVFLIEWLFKGLQDFKYITARTIVTRSLYVIAIFVFVRDKEDYILYFLITMVQIILNATINWRYSLKYVKFKFSLSDNKYYIYSLFVWGINLILISSYTTFNVLFMGFSCGNLAVGYYTTATKLYTIILSILQAYNGVFIPYLNSLYAQGEMETFLKTITKSFYIVSSFTIPMVVTLFCLAPQLIDVLAGSDYKDSIIPFRIILFEILVISISQITNSQILLSLKKDKEILIATISGAIAMITIVIFFVPQYAEIAAASAVLFSHTIEFTILFYFAKKNLKFKFPLKEYLMSAIYSLPIISICYFIKNIEDGSFFILITACPICLMYFILVQFYVIKNDFFITLFKKLKISIKSLY